MAVTDGLSISCLIALLISLPFTILLNKFQSKVNSSKRAEPVKTESCISTDPSLLSLGDDEPRA